MRKSFLIAAAGAAFCAAGANAQLIDNTTGNGSFENSGLTGAFDDWTSFGNVSQSFDFASDGIASAKIFGGFGGDSVFFQDVFPINPGDEVRASIKALTPDGDSIAGTQNQFRIALVFLDPTRPDAANTWDVGNTFLDGATVTSDMDGTFNGVNDFVGEVVGIAPYNTSGVQFVGVFLQPDFEGGAVWADEVLVEVISTGNALEIVNGDFEADDVFGHPINGWREFGNAIGNVFVNRDGTISGTSAGSVFGQFNGVQNESGFFQALPAAEGESWTMTADVLNPAGDEIAGDNVFAVSLNFRDSGGALLGETVQEFDASTASGSITPVSLSGTAPAGTVEVNATFVLIQPEATADNNNDGMIDGGDQGTGRVDVDNVTLAIGGPAECPGDIADDFGFAGADGQVSFGDFLAALGLLGPCPGGTPGCDFDIADDFGFAGGDGLVSFGDFLFALTILGPCP